MNKISAALIVSLVVILLLSVQIVHLNNVIAFAGNEYTSEISKYVDCQNTLEGAQIDLQRALNSK